jgi:para-aminobenzoate synthetase component I
MLKVFYTDDTDSFKSKALVWADSFNTACYFDSNNFSDPYSAFGVYIGAGKAAELVGSENKFVCCAGAVLGLKQSIHSRIFLI